FELQRAALVSLYRGNAQPIPEGRGWFPRQPLADAGRVSWIAERSDLGLELQRLAAPQIRSDALVAGGILHGAGGNVVACRVSHAWRVDVERVARACHGHIEKPALLLLAERLVVLLGD